jgi:ligand-binding sensor domain-containing protein
MQKAEGSTKFSKALFISFFLLLAWANSFAQVFHFDRVSAIDGESNLSVRKVVQDNKGFLWLATYNGLYMYEGGDFILKHSFFGTK